MFGIVLSALNAALAWVFRSVLVKFGLYFGLFFVTTEFMQVVTSSLSLPSGDGGLGGAFAGLPAGTWYFLDLMQAGYGVPAVASAWVTRFIIRRIPVIG